MEDTAKAHLNSWIFLNNSIQKEAYIFQKHMLRRMMVYVDWRRQKTELWLKETQSSLSALIWNSLTELSLL